MSSSGTTHTASWPIVLTGGISSLVLALGMNPTFASFTASISNSFNQAATGILVMQERNSPGTVTCLSTDSGGLSSNVASCSSINKYGGDLTTLIGGSVTTLSYIKNVGSVSAAVFSFSPGECVQTAGGPVAGTATDLCSQINVTITSGAVPIFSGTAQTLGSGGPIDVLSKLGMPRITSGTELGFAVTASIDGAVGNAYQGLRISQPMTWTFSS
jgi:hypothetical protein